MFQVLMTEHFGHMFLSDNVNKTVLGLRAELTGPRESRDLPQAALYVISELDLQIWLLPFKTENSLFPVTVLCFLPPRKEFLGISGLFFPYPQTQESLRWGLIAE